MDKKGRPRPEGYKMEVEPPGGCSSAAYLQGLCKWAFVDTDCPDAQPEAVPGRMRASKGWSPATVSRLLDNGKYTGKWVWNKSESRRDPRTDGGDGLRRIAPGEFELPYRNGSTACWPDASRWSVVRAANRKAPHTMTRVFDDNQASGRQNLTRFGQC